MKRGVKAATAFAALGAFGITAYLGAVPLAHRVLRANLPKIEAAASDLLGSQVRFDSLEPRLDWVRPEFEFRRVRVVDPESGEEPLTAGRIALQVDILASWEARAIRFGRVRVEDPGIELRERVPRRWHVRGLSSVFKDHAGGSSQGDSGDARTWVTPAFTLVIENARLSVRPFMKEASVSTLDEAALEFGFEEDRTVLRVRSAGISMNVPEWWGSERRVDSFAGRFVIGPSDAVRIEDGVLSYGGREIVAEADLQPEGQGFSAAFALGRIGARELLRELPHSLVDQKLRAWLERSVQAGELSSLAFKAESKGTGPARVVFSAQASGVDLDYAEGWPLVKSAGGRIAFWDDRLEFEVPSARWSGMDLSATKGVIRPGANGGPARLVLDGDARTPSEELLSFLRDGPVHEQAEPVLARLEPAGEIAAGFHLEIPLVESPDVLARFEIRKAGVDLPEQGIEIREVRGGLQFELQDSNSVVQLNTLKGRVFGDDLALAGSYTSGAVRSSGSFSLDATLPVAKLREWEPRVPGDEVLGGKLPVRLKLETERSSPDSPLRWTVEGQSNLAAFQLQLPAPLYKEKHQALPVQWEARGEGVKLHALKFGLEGDVSGAVTANVEYADTAAGRRLALRARTRTLTAGDWIEAIRRLADAGEVDPTVGDSADGQATESSPPPPLEFEMRIFAEELLWKDLRFEAVDMSMDRKANAWRTEVRSLAIDGAVEFRTPLPSNTLKARFTRLVLPKFPKDPNESRSGEESELDAEGQPKNPWDLSRWPSLDVVIERLRVGEQLYGQLNMQVRQTGSALKLERLDVIGPELEIRTRRGDAAYGKYRVCGVEGEMIVKHTVFPTRFKNLSTVEMKRARIQFDWVWAGGPEALSLGTLTGSMKGTIREGALKGVDSTAAKIFNFLSYADGDNRRKISRFYKSSFELAFQKGVIVSKTLKALFGSVFVKVTGEARVRDKSLEMEARVTPRVDDIPDPEAPAPVSAGGKPQEEEPSSWLSHTYRIRGTWDDPSVGLKVF